VNDFERRVRARVMASFRETSHAPSVDHLAADLRSSRQAVSAALHALAAEHALVLRPGSDAIWMAHPFSGVDTDLVVTIAGHRWFANCAWDGLSILALLGEGELHTHSPASGEPLRFVARGGTVDGAGLVHFLVPPRRFWDDIGFT
jgi:DNA-binding transcriptional MocR family regulator